MSAPLPFVVFSDGPSLPTGLARIARDLTARLWEARDRLNLSLLQVGWNPRPCAPLPWPSYSLSQLHSDGDWGCREIQEIWQEWFGAEGLGEAGILLSIWDPSRAFSMLPLQTPDRHLWGYFPMDGVNIHGTIGGPAREAVARFDRALGYGRWGAEALRGARGRSVAYLPHGLDLDVWRVEHTRDELTEAERVLRPRDGEWVLGCVATNQPRKDLALFCATLSELRRRGEQVRGWLHTDLLVRHWSVPQLLEDFGLTRHVSVSLSLPDAVLSACYSCCGATFAPGLGEGFGYPIVESLACGTPPIHLDYAGGAELVPCNGWRVPTDAFRLDGLYAIRRPIGVPNDVANAVQRAVRWKREEERVCQEYCRGAISHLSWDVLWPRWESWVRQGLSEYSG